MNLFFENRLGVDGLKLGSKVGKALSAAVRAAAGIVEGITIVMDFVAITTPEVRYCISISCQQDEEDGLVL